MIRPSEIELNMLRNSLSGHYKIAGISVVKVEAGRYAAFKRCLEIIFTMLIAELIVYFTISPRVLPYFGSLNKETQENILLAVHQLLDFGAVGLLAYGYARCTNGRQYLVDMGFFHQLAQFAYFDIGRHIGGLH